MHAKEKEQSHAQDNIYVVWQFVYVHEVAKISLLSGKNTKCGYSFSSHTKTRPPKKKKKPNWFFLYRKSPIKNHTTLFRSGQVIKPDQTKLSSTKPNRCK